VQRQVDAERRAGALGALDREPALVSVHDRLGDRQPEPDPGIAAAVARCVRKKRSNSRRMSACEIPMPVSLTSITAVSSLA
jgi:hypothetical protein